MTRDSTFRRRVLEATDPVCAECGTTEGPFEADHMHQRATGGGDETENGRRLCLDCHKRKTAKDAGVRAKIKRIRRKWFGEGKPERLPW